MALWTDIIDPETLTGYAREYLNIYEARKGSLAHYLPNRHISDIVAKFTAGDNGLIEIAAFRAFDAEPRTRNRKGGRRVTIELPALGGEVPISEYDQLRARGGAPSDESVRDMLLGSTREAVISIADAQEYMRGRALATGKAVIAQDDFALEDDFGRDPALTIASSTAAAQFTADPIAYLTTLEDLYETVNGERPGQWVVSRKVARALQAHPKLSVKLADGSTRPASADELKAILEGQDLAPLTVHARTVSVDGVATPVIPAGLALALPAPVDPDDHAATQLGATYWGRTLTSTEAEWAIPDSEQPGIVAGVWRAEKPPMRAEIISDAIGLPVLANANLSLAAHLVV